MSSDSANIGGGGAFSDVQLGAVHFHMGDSEDEERRTSIDTPLPGPLQTTGTDQKSSSTAAAPAAASPSPVYAPMAVVPPPMKIRRGASLGSPPVQVIFEDVNYVVKITAKEAKTIAHKLGDEYAASLPSDPKALVDRTILKKLSGVFQPGRLTAIMGPSGSGKTSLLNAIAGYVHVPRTSSLSGTLKLNGHPYSLSERRTQLYIRSLSAYVHQHDVILSTMTVREAIEMSALLRLPKSMPYEQKKERIEEVIDLLGLGKCSENYIGSATLKGISGGERRRVSIAMELLTNPSILFMDEPTSGLDTFTAYSVTNTLKTLAQQHQRTIIATIHQPNSDIFHLFDDLILLADGQIMYAGPAMGSLPYFSRYGFNCPEYSNPADWLFMKILYSFQEHGENSNDEAAIAETESHDSTDDVFDEEKKAGDETDRKPIQSADSTELSHDSKSMEDAPLKSPGNGKRGKQAQDNEKRHNLLSAWPMSPECAADVKARGMPFDGRLPHQPEDMKKVDRAGFGTQFRVLLRRAAFAYLRNKLAIGAQLGQAIFFGLLSGLLWFQLGTDQKTIQDRNGAIFFMCSGMLFGAAMGILNIFSSEKHIFAREYAAGMYSMPAYYFSRLLIEIPARIMQPIVMSCIAYFLVGLQLEFVHFVRFVVSLSLLQFSGMSIGMAIASLTPSIQVALPIVQMIFLPLMIFSGFFLNENNSPVYLGWITYLSPIKYTFTAAVKNEYYGLNLHCNSDQLVQTIGPDGNVTSYCPYTRGEQVITYLDFDKEPTIGENQYIMLGYSIAVGALAYLALYRTAKKI